jgi:hypothetical protein
MGRDFFTLGHERWRGVHSCYALLGGRGALGSRRHGDSFGDVPAVPPLALAALLFGRKVGLSRSGRVGSVGEGCSLR